MIVISIEEILFMLTSEAAIAMSNSNWYLEILPIPS